MSAVSCEKKGWVVSIGGVAAAAMVEARDTSTHHRIAKVASLQEKQRGFRHFISINNTIIKTSNFQQCKVME